MATDTTSTPPRPGRDSGPSARRRRRRPRWWLILLGAAAVIVIAIIVAIQLQPNAADGPPAVGATQVALRDTRFHPPVIQVTQGQTVTWSFDDQGTTHNVKGKGWGSGDQASGTFRHTFTAPGNYRYSCTLHLGMNGRVDVVARAAQHHENGRHGATERRRAGRGDDDHGLAGAASSASSAVLEGREIASW